MQSTWRIVSDLWPVAGFDCSCWAMLLCRFWLVEPRIFTRCLIVNKIAMANWLRHHIACILSVASFQMSFLHSGHFQVFFENISFSPSIRSNGDIVTLIGTFTRKPRTVLDAFIVRNWTNFIELIVMNQVTVNQVTVSSASEHVTWRYDAIINVLIIIIKWVTSSSMTKIKALFRSAIHRPSHLFSHHLCLVITESLEVGRACFSCYRWITWHLPTNSPK